MSAYARIVSGAHGHDLLQQVAARLLKAFRAEDVRRTLGRRRVRCIDGRWFRKRSDGCCRNAPIDTLWSALPRGTPNDYANRITSPRRLKPAFASRLVLGQVRFRKPRLFVGKLCT